MAKEENSTVYHNEDFDAIENCPCEDVSSSRPSLLSAMPIYNTIWEPIIIYRRDKKKQRPNSFRCPHHRRLVQRTGHATALHRLHVPLRYARYLRDVSNTMVNGRWRWVSLALVLCFSGLWLLFAWLWMLVSVARGDLEHGATGSTNHSCSVGVQGFAGFLLMSIETQRTGHATELHRLHVPLRYARYLRDVSNTMVNGRWRWVSLALVLCFSGLWLLFAWLWMLVSVARGDLEHGATGSTNHSCSVGVQGFAGFLLMSIETQTTIGYGSRYPTENCAEGVFMICLQMILGIGVEGAVLGMFYVKMTRPRLRDCRKIFSKIAVVCQRDGNLCLIFRIFDEDHLHIVGTVIRAWLTETVKTGGPEEFIEAHQKPLKLENHGLLLWPLTVVHKIDKDSPLYDVSARDLLVRKFEIIITLIGTSDSTGQLTQSRTSYLTSEIHWGHRFRACTSFDDAAQSYVVHQEMLNATEPVATPLCSAQRLDEVLGEYKDLDSGTSGIGTMTCSSPASPRGGVYLEHILETHV